MEFLNEIPIVDLVSNFANVNSKSSSEPKKTESVIVVNRQRTTDSLVWYIAKVSVTIYLINLLVPGSEIYTTLRILLYVMAVLGSGYPLLFLIILYVLGMKVIKA
jgi:hypothetical protein